MPFSNDATACQWLIDTKLYFVLISGIGGTTLVFRKQTFSGASVFEVCKQAYTWG